MEISESSSMSGDSYRVSSGAVRGMQAQDRVDVLFQTPTLGAPLTSEAMRARRFTAASAAQPRCAPEKAYGTENVDRRDLPRRDAGGRGKWQSSRRLRLRNREQAAA